MTTYIVNVCRISYASREIEVEANSAEEAEDKALDIAGNFHFNEYDAEYDVDYTIPAN
jgi:hypothetical protein